MASTMPSTQKDLITLLLSSFLLIGLLIISILCGVWYAITLLSLFIFKRRKFANFLSPQDLYFLSLEERFPFHLHPKKILLGAVTLQGKVDLNDFRSNVHVLLNQKNENGELVFGRLQQYITFFMGYYIFQWDKDFDIKNHVREIQTSITEADFLGTVQAELLSPFIPDSSMWEVLLAPNYNNSGNTMIFFRIQHCFGDGMSIMKLLTSASAENDAIEPKPTNKKETIPILKENVNGKLNLKNLCETTIRLPRQFLIEQSAKRNMETRSDVHEFHIVKLPVISLSKFKKLRAETGITFTMAITTSLSHALSLSMKKIRNGRHVPDYITAILLVPKPTVGKKDLGNSFGLVDFNVSLNTMSLEARLAKCQDELEIAKSSTSPGVVQAFFETGKVLPFKIFQKLFLPKRRHEQGIIISNLPGPQEAVKVFGSKVLELYWAHPALENPWLFTSIISYSGQIQIGFTGLSYIFGNQENMDQFANSFMEGLNLIFSKSSASFM